MASFQATAALLTGVLVVCAGAQSHASSLEPDAIVGQIRSARLDPSRAVEVGSLEIDMGLAAMRLEEGVLIPARMIGDRTLEMVFVGRARFLLEPPDAIEQQQLELFTGRGHLDVQVEQAVLLVANQKIVSRLLDRETVVQPDPAVVDQAKASFEQWVGGAERRGFGAEGALFKAVLDDEPAQGHFAVWCRSEELGDFYYLLDPFDFEQVGLGQFVPVEVDEIEQHKLERFIRRQKRQGRFWQFRLADLGDWNTWVSTSLSDESGRVRRGSEGFESEHYELDVEIAKGEVEIDGTATIDIRATSNGRRVVNLELFSDLVVQSIRDGADRELKWFRVDEEVYVVLAEPLDSGERLRLRVEYQGVLLDELMNGVYALRDTYAWYPHVGTADRATYEATLHWPKKYELLASGRLVEEGEEGNLRWQRRVLDIPSFAFTFEYGDYDVHTMRAGHVELTIGFSKVPSNWEKGAKDETIKAFADALIFLEERFGAYPFDHLTVATVPRGFSQGFLSFITLAHAVVAMPRGTYWILASDEFDTLRRESRDETIAHELSHQWWGNKVGWSSYRDQWLSEALADFSATSFVAEKAARESVYLARHGQRWRSSLEARTKDGRTLESLGPVVLGTRLYSSHSDRAYSAVVYDKGSVVFSMLARTLQPGPFSAMLKALADAVANRTIDTETFLQAVEKMSGVDLDEFAQQFVYGTGVPEVYYNYKIRQVEDGSWLIEGTATQIASSHYRYRLIVDDTGRWNVERERGEAADVSDRSLVVPFQIALRAGSSDDDDSRNRVERGLGGTLLLQGETSRFSIPVTEEPRLFWLDQRGEVLAEFFAENHRPKSVFKYKALELSGQEAEQTFELALAAPLYSEVGLAEIETSRKNLERRSRLEDAGILLYLARLYLDQGRDGEARGAFARALKNLGSLDKNRYKRQRMLLECRFDIREGNLKSAYSRLSKNLRLDFDRTSRDTIFDSARRKKFKSGWRMGGDAYALLALAAYETDHHEVALVAVEEAEERGADMATLRERMKR